MERHVKGACKPKNKAPQAKYVDPIISATFASDGSFHEVCRALATRLRDPNSVVVFKALIIVHTLVRVGNQETVLGYLSGTKMLGLENIVSGHDTAQNLSKYASYLDRRIRTYGAIKYDIIRDKSERRAEREGIKGCNRLRSLTVDKGLLRETTLLQKEMDALAECKFYLDDMDDDVTMSALRLLVKDLLLLFQAVNEGVINVLEHYFEMSHNDAATALKIYKRFCTQTESVVAYLGVAKKMQNIINVPIPNLKHAPVSLQKSLEEYLQDPNFEANRAEYKENKRIADGLPATSKSSQTNGTASASTTNAETSTPKQQTQPSTNNKIKSFQDFFESIESEQASMFNPQTGSPNTAYFQQQAAYNPFGSIAAQPTGYAMPLQAQATGFNAVYGLQMQPSSSMPQMPVQPQMTGFAPGGLLPQPTGYNPFRQSMMAFPSSQPMLQPQQTGMLAFSASQPNLSAFGGSQQPQSNQISTFNQAFGSMAPLQPQQTSQFQPSSQSQSQSQSSMLQPQLTGNPFTNRNNQNSAFRPMSASMPPSSNTSTGLQAPQNAASALVAQPTGSRNPFAPPPGTVASPPKPEQPSMNALAFNAFQQQQRSASTPPGYAANVDTSNSDGLGNGFGMSNSAFGQPSANGAKPLQAQATGGGGLFSNIASSFTGANNNAPSSNPQQPSLTSNPSFSSDKFAQNSSAFTPSISLSPPQRSATAPLVAQPTGFGGSTVKPFQPTSSFGTSLAESLGPISSQASASGSIAAPSVSSLGTGMSNLSFSGGSATSSSAPAFNPFRSSLLPSSTGSTAPSSLSGQPTGLPTSNNFSSQFSANFGNSFGSGFTPASQKQEETLI